MAETVLHALVTLVVVVDPLGQIPVFIALTRDADPAQRRRVAVRGITIAALVLFPFAFAGRGLLAALGIGLPAFKIAGGVLLLLLAVDMLLARETGLRSATAPERAEAWRREDISIFPLAIPLIAGPGAMTSVTLLVAGAEGHPLQVAAVLAVLAAVLAATLACLLSASAIMRLLGVTGANVIGRVLGIVLAALAVQFILNGLAEGLPWG